MILTASQYHLLVISVIYFVILIISIIGIKKAKEIGKLIPLAILQYATLGYLIYLACWLIYNWDRWHFPSLTPSFIHVIN
jgi:hypothetical protein